MDDFEGTGGTVPEVVVELTLGGGGGGGAELLDEQRMATQRVKRNAAIIRVFISLLLHFSGTQ